MSRNRPTGHHVVALAAFLGAFGVLASAAAVAAAIGSVHRSSVAASHFEPAGMSFSYPGFNAAEWLLLGLATMGGAGALVAVRACWRQRAAYRRFLGQLEVLGQLEAHPTVQVIADPRPQAFCAGFLRPTVYVSRRAIELLTEAELEAVLAHEYRHRRVRDPLRFACGRILAQALFFVPALRSLCARYADLAELRADRAAVQASAGQQAPLASALLVFEASALPGVSGISSHRVDSLLGNEARWRPPWWLIGLSCVSLSSLSLLVWRSSQVATAHATFNLPFLTSTPCAVMALLLPTLGCLLIARRRLDVRRA